MPDDQPDADLWAVLQHIEAWCDDADPPPPHHVIRGWKDALATALGPAPGPTAGRGPKTGLRREDTEGGISPAGCDTRVGGHDWSDEDGTEPLGPAYCYACGMQKRDYKALVEYEESFRLYNDAIRRGTAMWRAVTGRHDVLPDTADLVAWLLKRLPTEEEVGTLAEALLPYERGNGADLDSGGALYCREGGGGYRNATREEDRLVWALARAIRIMRGGRQ